MECPNCGKDTPSNMKYCKYCGNALDLDFEKVGESIALEAEQEVLQRTEERCRGYLFLSLFVLFVVIGLYLIVRKPQEVEVIPPYFATFKEIEAPEKVELKRLSLPIPK
jgi:hypothetical protein